jgi:hypothetical protein
MREEYSLNMPDILSTILALPAKLLKMNRKIIFKKSIGRICSSFRREKQKELLVAQEMYCRPR